MKKSMYLVLALLAVFAIACNKDDGPKPVDPEPIGNTDPDPDPDPEPENQAPGAFSLLEVKDRDTAVTLTPTFRWNTSTDPDGDMVRYDLLIGKDKSALDTLASDLNTATHQVADRLSLFTEYFWTVAAKDGMGLAASSDTLSFVTRRLNNPMSATTADFSPRVLHTVTFYNDKLWLYAGQNENDILVDVWSSDDGVAWTDHQDPGFGPLRGHAAVSFQGTLWFLGGRTTVDTDSRTNRIIPTVGDDLSDIPSYDAPWSARELHTAAVFQDKVWVLGGVNNENELRKDLWSTSDVEIWVPNGEAPWSARFGHTSVVFDDKLWVIGGKDDSGVLNDVWSSEDGVNWIRVTPGAEFPARVSHASVVYDNKIWVYGGGGGGADESVEFNDVWYSENGIDWTEFVGEGNFEPVVRPTLTVLNDQILLIGGGRDGTYYSNEVWVFD